MIENTTEKLQAAYAALDALTPQSSEEIADIDTAKEEVLVLLGILNAPPKIADEMIAVLDGFESIQDVEAHALSMCEEISQIKD